MTIEQADELIKALDSIYGALCYLGIAATAVVIIMATTPFPKQ